MAEQVTFSFGKNWCDYLSTVTEQEIDAAIADIRGWLGEVDVSEKTVIDVGSGSGIHSLSFHRLGVGSLRSMDIDPHSVKATTSLWEKAGKPESWTVEHGSILDVDLIKRLEPSDIVYSWGVLHHTGEMWQAIENATQLVKPDGLLWISLYTKGHRYAKDLALKQAYNAATDAGKLRMVRWWILKDMWRHVKRFKNPFRWFSKSKRGMNSYHDLIDWLGGLPYEVADPNEIIRFGLDHGFVLERIGVAQQGACSIYVLRRVPQLIAEAGSNEASKAA